VPSVSLTVAFKEYKRVKSSNKAGEVVKNANITEIITFVSLQVSLLMNDLKMCRAKIIVNRVTEVSILYRSY
jgi:hypothetical protein